MKAPIVGRKVNEIAIDSLIDALEKTADEEAVLYVGYPVAATADEAITIPALLTSLKYGLIAFDVRASIKAEDVPEVQQRQDEIVLAIKAKLLQHRSLTKGRSRHPDQHPHLLPGDSVDKRSFDFVCRKCDDTFKRIGPVENVWSRLFKAAKCRN